MGDIAEMMLAGILCEECGSFVDIESNEFPRLCNDCSSSKANRMLRKIGKQEFQEHSEINLFNKIGLMSETLGCNPVYFKVEQPKLTNFEGTFEFEYKYMHYIHLYKDDDMKISIYYDKYNLGSMLSEEPYFELYDRCDVERFFDTEEDINNLLSRVNDLLSK